jgi:peptidoglycan/xylan/chitin deacetylase (PgdA/CDA1 family)
MAYSESRNNNYITILLYHKFNEPHSPTTSIPIELFEKHLRFLKDNNYNVITPLEFYDMLQGEKPVPLKTVLITIDDGYRSVYTEAYPLLKKYKFPFLVFLYMEAVTRYPDFMTKEQIQELIEDKKVFLGNHSYSHARFARWPEGLKNKEEYINWIKADHERSINAFRRLTGHKPLFFAYPYGEYNKEYYDIIKSSGYLLAFTQDPVPVNQNTNPYLVSRFALVGSWAEMERFREFLQTEPIDVKSHFPDFGLVNTPGIKEVKFLIDRIGDYKNLGIYISELGWLEPVVDKEKGIIKVEIKEKLKRDINRIGITGFNKRTGRWARFFYMIIKR